MNVALKKDGMKILLFLILLNFAVGIDVLYAGFYHTDSSWVTRVTLGTSPDQGKKTEPDKVQAMLLELESWAEDNQASLIINDPFRAGCGYCTFSESLSKMTGIRILNHKLYIRGDKDANEMYIGKDDMFLPGQLNMPIEGTFNADGTSFFGKVDFIYPLEYVKETGGTTLLTDRENVEGLVAILRKYGSEPTAAKIGRKSFPELMQTAFRSKRPAAVIFFMAILTQVFCYFYISLYSYKKQSGAVRNHRIFGLSRRNLMLRLLLRAFISLVCLLAADYLIISILMKSISGAERFSLMWNLAVAAGLIVVISDILGYCILRSSKKDGGRL